MEGVICKIIVGEIGVMVGSEGKGGIRCEGAEMKWEIEVIVKVVFTRCREEGRNKK